MILRKPITLIIVLSLFATVFLAVPQPAQAIVGECDPGYTMLAYYRNDGVLIPLPGRTLYNMIRIQYDSGYYLKKGSWIVLPPYRGWSWVLNQVVITDSKSNRLVTNFQPGVYTARFSSTEKIQYFTFCVQSTPVVMESFTARSQQGSATIDWTTATEIETAGFLLYRSTTSEKPDVQVTADLIAAQGDEVTGASYRFTDHPGFGTFYYWLENVDYSGESYLSGPAMVKILPAVRQPAYRPSLPGQ